MAGWQVLSAPEPRTHLTGQHLPFIPYCRRTGWGWCLIFPSVPRCPLPRSLSFSKPSIYPFCLDTNVQIASCGFQALPNLTSPTWSHPFPSLRSLPAANMFSKNKIDILILPPVCFSAYFPTLLLFKTGKVINGYCWISGPLNPVSSAGPRASDA